MAVAAVAEETKPPRLVFVYTWDILRAVGAVVGAFTAFAGGIDVNGRAVALPLWQQITAGVSGGAYAGALIVVAMLLVRRQAWVRTAQLILLVLSAVLIVFSLLVEGTAGLGLAPLLCG